MEVLPLSIGANYLLTSLLYTIYVFLIGTGLKAERLVVGFD